MIDHDESSVERSDGDLSTSSRVERVRPASLGLRP
jgi:hypothetical protein